MNLHAEFVPATEADSRRLMIVLHGLGDSAAGYRWLPGALRLPWMNYLLVNAPDDYFGGYSWFDIAGDPAPGLIRSRKLLFELLDARRAEGWPTEQTVMFGFSQGCILTLEIGLRYPHKLAGLIGISGKVAEVDKVIEHLSPVARQQWFMMTHGPLDPWFPIATVREEVNRLKRAGLNVDWREFLKAHTIAGDDELDVIRDFVRGRFVN